LKYHKKNNEKKLVEADFQIVIWYKEWLQKTC